jgi:hypothetical protein
MQHGKRCEQNHEPWDSWDSEGRDYGWKSLGRRITKPELFKRQDVVCKIKHENGQLLDKFLYGLYNAE